MPNCDAGMTSEVHKCFHEQRRNLVSAPDTSLTNSIAAVAVCLAVCPATAPILRAYRELRSGRFHFRKIELCFPSDDINGHRLLLEIEGIQHVIRLLIAGCERS
jgi:hypothetical protein